MLAAVRERLPGAVRTVHSAIETLQLDGPPAFEVVLLASFLVHAGTEGVREGLLGTCRRYVADDGCVVIQRESPGLHLALPYACELPDGGLIRLVSSEPSAVGRPGTRSLRCEYRFPDARWTQTYLSCPLTEEEFEGALAQAGLELGCYLDEERTWARAVPGARAR